MSGIWSSSGNLNADLPGSNLTEIHQEGSDIKYTIRRADGHEFHIMHSYKGGINKLEVKESNNSSAFEWAVLATLQRYILPPHPVLNSMMDVNILCV